MIRKVLSGCLAGLAAMATGGFAQAEQRNVLLIMADDFNHWITPAGYYDQADTPNINALAAKGVLFSDASSSSPVCNPSRQAIMTGLRGTTSGIDSNKAPYFRNNSDLKNVVTLHHYFKNAGYYAFAGGKLYHNIKMGTADTDPQNWSDLSTQGGGGGSAGSAYRWKSDNLSPLVWSGNTKGVESTGDRKLARLFERKLKNYSDSKPFFMGVGLFRPHLPWHVPKEYYDQFNSSELADPPGLLRNDLSDTPYKAHKAMQEVRDEGQYKNMLRAYLANLKFTDDNVGIILDGLNANGKIRDNTIVAFMGDHGWMLGEKESLQKGSVYDQASRTTLIIYDPQARGNGKVSRKVVSLLDVHRTLIDLAGLPDRRNIEGNSLRPLLANPNREDWDKPIFISLDGREIIKTNKWRYVRETTLNGSKDSLYDIVNDPYEWNNLAQDASYKSVIADLRKQLSDEKQRGSEVLARVKRNAKDAVDDTPTPTNTPTSTPTNQPEPTPTPTASPTPLPTPSITPTPSQPPLVGNEIFNGDFEAGLDEWNKWQDNSLVRACGPKGSQAIKLLGSSAGGVWQTVSLRGGTRYRLSATARVFNESARAKGTIGIQFRSGSATVQRDLLEFSSSSFETKELVFTAPADASFDRAQIYVYNTKTGANFCADQLSIVQN